MNLHNFYAVICTLCNLKLIEIYAYPAINVPFLFGSAVADKYKRSDSVFPQTDADVLELEHLKRNHNDENENADAKLHHINHSQQQQIQSSHVTVEDPLKPELELLPELERQLESATPSMTTTTTTSGIETGQLEPEQTGAHGGHRPPMLQQHDGGKLANGNQQQTVETANAETGSAAVPSMTKPFYGAARLAFGQNPEVLPTSLVSTSTTSTTTPSTSAAENDEISSESVTTAPETNLTSIDLATVIPDQEQPPPVGSIDSNDENNKEIIGDVALHELKRSKSAERRSVTIMPPKMAESLLRHRDGQYSSFDMAQYVFWTGDEAGLARAVEEFVEQGLMSRENALKFLRDIRLGIEYLQRSYANRIFPDELRQNNINKKSYPKTTTTSTTTTTTTTEKPPLPYIHLEQGSQNNARLAKTLDSISMWNKLQELSNEGRQDISDYDEATGRAKIAEFLYTEYTLEEILYKLAKVMFTQSLAHGSDEAQQELQKLTDFLEREGNLGVIPIDLQKKVLHVLLSALSDTLTEHPELLPAARLNLANSYNRLPLHAYGAIN